MASESPPDDTDRLPGASVIDRVRTRRGAIGSGHLAYGAATGGAFYVLECRQRAWARLDPRIEKQERLRRRHVGTPAPAVWLFTLGIGVFVVLLLL